MLRTVVVHAGSGRSTRRIPGEERACIPRGVKKYGARGGVPRLASCSAAGLARTEICDSELLEECHTLMHTWCDRCGPITGWGLSETKVSGQSNLRSDATLSDSAPACEICRHTSKDPGHCDE